MTQFAIRHMLIKLKANITPWKRSVTQSRTPSEHLNDNSKRCHHKGRERRKKQMTNNSQTHEREREQIRNSAEC